MVIVKPYGRFSLQFVALHSATNRLLLLTGLCTTLHSIRANKVLEPASSPANYDVVFSGQSIYNRKNGKICSAWGRIQRTEPGSV